MDRTTVIRRGGGRLWAAGWSAGWAAVLLLALMALVAGCGERPDRRAAGGAADAEAEAARWTAVSDSLWQAVGCAQALPETFSANYQLGFKERPASGAAGKSVRLSGQVRLSAEGVLWLSAGMFGLEAFRIWLKQDSIWIVNRMEATADVYALSVWRHRWPFLALGAQAERRFVTAVLLGLIPDQLQRAEVVYMERRPAAAGGAEVLRFGLQPAAGQATAWTGLLVCDVESGNYRLQGLYWLMPEALGFEQPLQTVGAALPAAAAAALDGAVLSLRCPTADSRRLDWRRPDGSGVEIQLDYNRQKWNEAVEVSTDLPKKYTLRYAE